MSKKIRALIADDEMPARNKMKRLLEKFDHIELVHISENGIDALDQIHELKPDVVFLDIEMPGMNGLEVVENISMKKNQLFFMVCYDYLGNTVKIRSVYATQYFWSPS